MLNLTAPLFEGQLIRLTPVDYDVDPTVVSRWTHNSEYVRLYSNDPVRPLSPEQVKKNFEKIEKEMEENHRQFYFHVRTKDENRLIGVAHIDYIEWNTGSCYFRLGIPEISDRRRGYGSEVFNLLARYTFNELNLFRMTAVTVEYNPAALAFFEKHGFTLEVRRREALYRDNRRWDQLQYGLLRSEWLERNSSKLKNP
jgi:RimJ/RimL family protein N-acetyltransferase